MTLCTKTGTFHNQKSMHKISVLIYLVEIAIDCLACRFTSDKFDMKYTLENFKFVFF